MFACTACDAFVPSDQTACPCCDAPCRRSWWKRFVNLARVAGGGAVAMTLMACYGGPAYRYQPDDVAPIDSSDTATPSTAATTTEPEQDEAGPR